MNDLISRKQLVIELQIEIGETYNDDIIKGIRRAIEIVESQLTVEPVRGEWKYDCDLYFSTCRCSECNTLALKRYNFCPECGADMRGEENDS